MIDSVVARDPFQLHSKWQEAGNALATGLPTPHEGVVRPSAHPRVRGGHAQAALQAGPPVGGPQRRRSVH